MEMFLWMIVPILLLLLVTYYLYRVIRRGLDFFQILQSGKKRKIAAVIAALVIIVPALSIYSTWLIVVLHLAGCSLLLDLIVWLCRKLSVIQKLKNSGAKVQSLVRLLQRCFYSGAIAILLSVTLLGYGYWNMHHIVETDYTVTTQKQIRPEGYRIALLADLHFGTTMDADKLKKKADKISEQHPDIVVLAGDIVDESTTLKEMQDAFAILGTIDNQFGICYVYGNHDKSVYSRSPKYTREELTEAAQNAGIHILEDSSLSVNGELELIGRADRSEDGNIRMSAEQLLENVDLNRELILIDHQPCEYDAVEKAGYDCILSGHTHAGQIWPGGLIARTFHFDDRNYGYGISGNLNEFVTSGIAGWGYPIRTEKHSEFVMITLVQK